MSRRVFSSSSDITLDKISLTPPALNGGEVPLPLPPKFFHMIGAFWILLFTILVGIILYLFELKWRRNHNQTVKDSTTSSDYTDSEESANPTNQTGPTANADGEVCCGQHLVCEKDSLSPFTDEIIYYDDEELDRFIGRPSDSYTPAETEEFRDVLMTLRHDDIAGWARSITQRHLELPPDVRDELLILVNEYRFMAK